MELNIEIPRKISLAYGAACKGLCRELDLPLVLAALLNRLFG